MKPHAIEAFIDKDGSVRLLETVRLDEPRRALVIILNDEPAASVAETAALSEGALKDWNRPEEDMAWSYLQRER